MERQRPLAVEGTQTYATFEDWWAGPEADHLYHNAELVQDVCRAAFEAGRRSIQRRERLSGDALREALHAHGFKVSDLG